MRLPLSLPMLLIWVSNHLPVEPGVHPGSRIFNKELSRYPGVRLFSHYPVIPLFSRYPVVLLFSRYPRYPVIFLFARDPGSLSRYP